MTNQVRIPVFFFNIALYSLNKIIILIYEYVYILFEHNFYYHLKSFKFIIFNILFSRYLAVQSCVCTSKYDKAIFSKLKYYHHK